MTGDGKSWSNSARLNIGDGHQNAQLGVICKLRRGWQRETSALPGKLPPAKIDSQYAVVFTDCVCRRFLALNPLPTSDVQVIDIAGSGLGLRSRLAVNWRSALWPAGFQRGRAFTGPNPDRVVRRAASVFYKTEIGCCRTGCPTRPRSRNPYQGETLCAPIGGYFPSTPSRNNRQNDGAECMLAGRAPDRQDRTVGKRHAL
jgi:hypothetical protein